MSKITGRDKRVADWLEKIGIDPLMTRRVVIDIPYNGAVRIYIEGYGDSSIFEIEPPPDLTTAIRVEPPQDDFEEAISPTKRLHPYIFEDTSTVSGEELKELYTPTLRSEWIDKWERPDD